MTENQLRKIFDKTDGHCHFCGNKLDFKKRGKKSGSLEGYWEVDHVFQRAKGGSASSDNCLPACVGCNRLRWHRNGLAIRKLMLLGIIAYDEIRSGTELGKQLAEKKRKRKLQNKNRRSNRSILETRL